MRLAAVYNLCGAAPRDRCSALGIEGPAQLREEEQYAPPTASGSTAARLLAGHRRRLVELLGRAEAAAPREPAELRLAAATPVEALNDDLLRLYRLAENGTLTRNDQTIVLPALERLRDTLRHRGSRVYAMSDTLHKAIAGLPASG